MYITHSLLSDEDWNTLAEAAKWSRNNADVLVDTHWIGGDPNKLEVYGWASWSPRAGICTLRNPSDKPQTYSMDVAKAFELPPGAPRIFQARSPWHENRDRENKDKNKNDDAKSIRLVAGEPHTISLKPFEVLNLEALPEH